MKSNGSLLGMCISRANPVPMYVYSSPEDLRRGGGGGGGEVDIGSDTSQVTLRSLWACFFLASFSADQVLIIKK